MVKVVELTKENEEQYLDQIANLEQIALETMKKEGRIVFKQLKNGKYNVYKKFYEFDKDGKINPESIFYDLTYNQNGKEEIKKIFKVSEGREVPFSNAKPTDLIKYILNFISMSLIVDDAQTMKSKKENAKNE